MTAPVHELIEAANTLLPSGWDLQARVLREHKFRNLWRVTAYLNDFPMRSWRTYRVGAALPAIVEWVVREAVGPQRIVVTADGDGFIQSIEEAP